MLAAGRGTIKSDQPGVPASESKSLSALERIFTKPRPIKKQNKLCCHYYIGLTLRYSLLSVPHPPIALCFYGSTPFLHASRHNFLGPIQLRVLFTLTFSPALYPPPFPPPYPPLSVLLPQTSLTFYCTPSLAHILVSVCYYPSHFLPLKVTSML